MSSIFHLPDVGEGLTEAEILSWKVQPGSTVEVNQVVLEIETAKSVVELPSPYAGTVESIIAAEGETVEVGAPLISVRAEGEAGAAESDTSEASQVEKAPPEEAASVETPRDDVVPEPSATDRSTPSAEPTPSTRGSEETEALVGSGPKADPVRRRTRKRPIGATSNAGATSQDSVAAGPAAEQPETLLTQLLNRTQRSGGIGIAERAKRLAEEGREALKWLPGRAPEEPAGEVSGHRTVGSEPPRRPALAKPPVRKAAKDLGIDLADVPATGSQGQVTQRDLVNFAANSQDVESRRPANFWAERGASEDRVERVPVKGVRKATAKAMVKSAFEAPHVSIFVDVDASRTMEFVKRLKASPTFEGVKVTPLLILAKAVIWATARNPQVNSQWTDSEILIKRYLNLGIAAATPRGLMVPNIKDAQDLSLRELAVALNALTKKAREGKTQPGDMASGTMTITNIGALGIDTGTPIINPGEAAIVAFGTIKQKPWVVDGEVIPRWVTTLGGSFDHRIVDGDLSARFMADVAAVLEEPALLLDM
ncbi:2-oxo acid dehydrogenase subunit E2 [Kocuria sp. HSID16901]|uniref:2-oxo acid dehydrogenase subunit E2 n=1 Tax=Kocuria sp. HSID16901 TaxID=2419505 RepID=UPI000661759E|nr:dihydrolipoamide acetyltransferase family protein [Kocuria sp. HSID16901]MCT1368297.1 2-oxo acid dehydrogenase subunit E2 [Rothia sp. p3-SID1597]RUQ23204.1 2-oxo acid dehydrogenase subunit E2 [Kocuria sp. HSID16901]